MKRNKIVVTGASGFIGKSACKTLASLLYDVIPVVRTDCKMENQVIINQPYSNLNSLKLLEDCDTIVHLAGRAHILNDKYENPLEKFREINVGATKCLAALAAQAGVRRFIFISSIGVNGSYSSDKPFDSFDPPKPKTDYAISKFEAEVSLKQICQDSGLEFVIIRPPLVYGKNAPGNFSIMKKCIEKGYPIPLGSITENRRSLVGLDNLIDLIAECIRNPAATNQTFLAGDGEDLSTAELLKRLGEAIGRPARLLKIPERLIVTTARVVGKSDWAEKLLGNLQVDIAHTCKTLGWKPSVSIDEGLRRTI